MSEILPPATEGEADPPPDKSKGPDGAITPSGAENTAQSAKPSDDKNNNKPPSIQLIEDEKTPISRPLDLSDGQAYAVAHLRAKGSSKGPQKVVVVVQGDGIVFAGYSHPIIDKPLTELGRDLDMRELPSETISFAAIKRFRARELPNPSAVFADISGIFGIFVDFNRSLADQSAMCELCTCWCIATYFLPTFDVAGYLWIIGESGSGKTQLLNTVSRIAFLGRTVLGSSSYAASRDAAGWGATVCFDDSEIIDDNAKREMILSGSRRGTKPIHKVKDGDQWESVEVDIFANRAFSAIERPDPVMATRTIVIPMARSANSPKTQSDPNDDTAWPRRRSDIIDDLWLLSLSHLPKMRTWYDEAGQKASLIGRDLDPWRGTLAVALWLQTDHGRAGLFDRMNQLSVDYQKQRQQFERGADSTRLAIRALLEMQFKSKISELTFDAAALANRINEIAREDGLIESDESLTNPKRAGWLLRNLRRFTRAPKGTNNRPWVIKNNDLTELAAAYNVSLSSKNAGNAGNTEPST